MQVYQPTITGSLSVSGSVNISGSINIAGGGTISGTASIALTASSADNLLVRNTLTAQTLVVQTITSSVDFVTGSTRFGSLSANTHVFTGSMDLTGSLTVVTTGTEFQVNANGVKFGNVIGDAHNITGSVLISGSIGIGTTTPDGKLHVFGKTYARYGQDDMFAFYYDDNYRFGITNPSTDLRQLRVFTQAIDNVGFIVFATANNVERMRITSAGVLVAGYTAAVGTAFSPPIQSKAGVGAGNGFGIISANNEMAGGIGLSSSSTNGIIITADPDNLRASSDITFNVDGATKMIISSGGIITANSYAAMTGGTFDVPAGTTKTVTVAFNGGNIHAFLGFSSQSGGITGAGSKSIFLGGTTNDGSGHTPTVLSTFSYGDQVVGAATTNTSAGFTFTITNNKGSAVSWSWSAFGSFGSITVS